MEKDAARHPARFGDGNGLPALALALVALASRIASIW